MRAIMHRKVIIIKRAIVDKKKKKRNKLTFSRQGINSGHTN